MPNENMLKTDCVIGSEINFSVNRIYYNFSESKLEQLKFVFLNNNSIFVPPNINITTVLIITNDEVN